MSKPQLVDGVMGVWTLGCQRCDYVLDPNAKLRDLAEHWLKVHGLHEQEHPVEARRVFRDIHGDDWLVTNA